MLSSGLHRVSIPPMPTVSNEGLAPQPDSVLPPEVPPAAEEAPVPAEPVAVAEPAVDPPLDPEEDSRPLAVPTSTWALLLILLLTGAIMFAFAWLTVHRRNPEDLEKNPAAARASLQLNYWIDYGYLSSGGLLVWKTPTTPLMFYRSSTGGMQLSGYFVENLYAAITGRYSWRLLAIHNQVVTLLAALVLGLLGFRVATRMGVKPLHALAIAVAMQAVHFTFPDNLFVYFEMSARIPMLFFAGVFLLLEEASIDRRTRALTVAQGLAAFALTYMEHVAGLAFIVSYFVVSLLLGGERRQFKRLLLVSIFPMLMALGVYANQLSWMRYLRPEAPMIGADFASRSGFDGSTAMYVDHLDIARKRDLARANWPAPNNAHLFRWKWLFFAGTAALVWVLIAAMRGRVAPVAVVAALSLLGSYLLYAGIFTQAVIIHPYLYDVLLFTPLAFALFAVLPALVESMTGHRGLAVAILFFLAFWVSMSQIRKYALMYPPAKKVAATVAAPHILPT